MKELRNSLFEDRLSVEDAESLIKILAFRATCILRKPGYNS